MKNVTFIGAGYVGLLVVQEFQILDIKLPVMIFLMRKSIP